jgi:hypothetical protein
MPENTVSMQEFLSKLIKSLQKEGLLSDLDSDNTSQLSNDECRQLIIVIQFHISQLSCFK